MPGVRTPLSTQAGAADVWAGAVGCALLGCALVVGAGVGVAVGAAPATVKTN